MSAPTDEQRRLLPVLAVALSLTVIFIVALSIPLGAAADLALSRGELTGWVVALYGTPGVLSLVLVWRYRQPLLLTGNIFVLIFVASLGGQLRWAELVGASMTAGAIVLVLGLLGLTDRLAAWLPAPVVFGVLAGAVLPFFVGLFRELGDHRIMVGATLAAFLVGRRFLEPRVPAVLPALVVGLAAAALTGNVGTAPSGVAWPVPAFTAPEFTLAGLVTATPVIVVLITLQANAPSVVFLRDQGYEPPERTLTTVSGAGTLAASVFGAADLERLIARGLLLALVGLAVVGVFATALKQLSSGPLVLGPVFAFGIAISDLSLLGLGPFFWALAFGLTISRLVERDAWTALQTPQREQTAGT